MTLVEGEVYAILYDVDEYWYRALVESVINEEKVSDFCWIKYESEKQKFLIFLLCFTGIRSVPGLWWKCYR